MKDVGIKVRPKKSLGQHFLKDHSVVDIMISQLNHYADIVLEIGPGTGVLTKKLLTNDRIGSVIAIEIDKEAYDYITHHYQQYILDKKLRIIQANAISMPLENIASKLCIIANMPYCSGGNMLLNWMHDIEVIDQIIIMLQNEVVDRIVAMPKTHSYGKISVIIQAICDVRKVLTIPPESFYPIPKVMSAIVSISPKTIRISTQEWLNLNELCTFGFMHRRKMLINIIKKCYEPAIVSVFLEFCKNYDYPSNVRIEEISVHNICKLSHAIYAITK